MSSLSMNLKFLILIWILVEKALDVIISCYFALDIKPDILVAKVFRRYCRVCLLIR
jgi:hypothetical protein